MNEDQVYDAAEREMDIYRAQVTRITRERDESRAAHASTLAWFDGQTGTRREATVTRAQLASAYRDGGLSVPEELVRFL